MASSSETGHSKNITTFETLILTCTGYGADYIPSNTDLALTNLTAQHLDCKQSVKDVKTAEAPFNDVEGQRQLIFKPLKPTSTKVLNALKGAKAPATVIADAETLNRKIQGKRADNSPPTTVDSTPPNSISVSQQSYDMQIDNFEKLIELADIEPKYNPNEVPLKIVTLQAYHGQLETINTTVKNTYIPYKNALYIFFCELAHFRKLFPGVHV